MKRLAVLLAAVAVSCTGCWYGGDGGMPWESHPPVVVGNLCDPNALACGHT